MNDEPTPRKQPSKSRKQVRDREIRALELFRAGVNQHEIARQLGYADHSGVSRMLKRVLEGKIAENADEIRALELDRLDAMLQSIWAKCRRGDEKAIETVLKIMDRRRKYVGGLEVPQQVHMQVEEVSEEEFYSYLLGAKDAFEMQKKADAQTDA